MKQILLSSVLIMQLQAMTGQPASCIPHPGTTIVCDSIARMCRVDAHYLTMMSVSKPTSQWYDSVHYPQELEFNYTAALCALYNDLPDTLADFRAYIPNLYAQAIYFHPDSFSIVTIIVSQDALEKTNEYGPVSGNRRVDSVMNVAGLTFVGYGNGNYSMNSLLYKCPPNVNRAWVERYLKKINANITISPVPKFRKWHYMIDIDEGPDTYTITLMEGSKCMPPELMCTYIKRSFTWAQEWSVRYAAFERGIVPWPTND